MSSRPIQALAQGFLGLLGVKNLGKLPDTLLNEVRPVIDMQPWYLLGSSLLDYRTTASNLDGTTTGMLLPSLDQFATNVGPMTVPDGQMWYLHECQARLVSTTDLINANGCYSAAQVPFGAFRHPILSTVPLVLVNPLTPPAGAQLYEMAFPPLRDVWLPAGSQLGAWMGQIECTTGGFPDAANVFVTARYTPVTI